MGEKTEAVAEPSHDLSLSVLDGGVAVLDKTAEMLTVWRSNRSRSPAWDGLTAPPDVTIAFSVD